jgi:predicted Rossmann fold flavoprotein
MFPITDSSRTIIDCLVNEARSAGVRLFTRTALEAANKGAQGSFELSLAKGESVTVDRLLLATGGSRSTGGAQIAHSLGHTIVPPVPSLFSFHISTPWLRLLPGISLPEVELSVTGTRLRERGPMLVTHNGVSGPAVLRVSAWGARILHELDYEFILQVRWLPELNEDEIRAELESLRRSRPNRRVINSPIAPLPARLWEQLTIAAGIDRETRWTTLPRAQANELALLLSHTQLEVNGKSLNKEEFVTCGGVSLREINFKTMESRLTPGLYFAGELLDVDGITGGFNFQAAWATGWIAGHSMAGAEPPLVV